MAVANGLDAKPTGHTRARVFLARCRALPASFWYIAGASVLVAVYFTFPEHHLWLWTPLGLSGVVATLVGVRRNRPSQPWAWYCFAMALFCFVAGDTAYNVMTDVLKMDNPFPSIADAFYLVMYPLVACGLLLLVRARSATADRAALLDALTVATGVGLFSWVYLILPYVQASDLTLIQRATSVAYPLGDVLVLTMLARLLSGGLRVRALLLLAVGAGGLLVSDILYAWIQLNGSWHVGGPVDAGWVVYYVAWGAAALDPSMTRVTNLQPPRPAHLHPMQIVVLAVASLIAPGVLLLQSLTDGPSHPVTIALFSATLFTLVITRLAAIVRAHEHAVRRERALRAYGESLVTAQTPADICNAALEAVTSLARRGHAGDEEWLHVPAEHGPDLPHNHEGEAAKLWALAERGGRLSHDLRTSVSPLRYDGDLRGILVVRRRSGLAPEVHDALCALAAQTALALESATQAAAARQLRQDARFKALIQNASDILVVLTADGSVAYGSPSLERRLGAQADALTDLSVADLLDVEDRDAAVALIGHLTAGGPGTQAVADWQLRDGADGSSSFEVVAQNLLEDPNVRGVVLTMRDVSERRELERQLAHQAFHDALTGLANRIMFHERAQHALTALNRRPGHLAMIMLDLDDFKIVNDTMGHAAGDDLLVAVAQRLTQTMRRSDTVARFGGDEFAVLMEDVDSPAAAARVADRIVARLAEPFDILGEPVQAGASAGLVVVGGADSEESVSLSKLLRNADLALYAAKAAGRGKAVPYEDGLHTKMIERVSRKSELHAAIGQGQLTLLYQPIVAIESGRVIGVEALVRWRHPERGLLGPGEFIPLAEESGLIVELGQWVLAHACRQAAEWGSIAAHLRMSVNVSGRQLQRPGFVEEVANVLRETQLARGRLVLELTESVLMHDVPAMPPLLRALRELGARVAIDDFGVGYSSLGYLQRFAIDVLKIDKSFVDHLGEEPGNGQGSAVANAVVSLAKALQLETVAEGIERVEQRDAVWDLGCRLGQGYLFSRPLPAQAMTDLLVAGDTLGPQPPRGANRQSPRHHGVRPLIVAQRL